MVLNKQNYLVIGSALSGIKTAEFLLSKGVKVTMTDIKPIEQLSEEITLLEKKPNFKGVFGMQPEISVLENIECIIVSPGVPMDISIINLAKEKKIEIINEVELAYRLTKTQIIAITGTNGKTTTTSLVGEILNSSGKNTYVVGNIGIPMISLIDKAKENDYFVVETSSFQLESTKDFKPRVSAILNITPDHLDRHKTMENYINAKSKIFENQQEEDLCILNGDDPISFSLKDKIKSKVFIFSRIKNLESGVFVRNNKIIIRENGENLIVCAIEDIKIPGKHNLENILAAIAISYKINVPIKVIKNTILCFKGVSHRIEHVDTIDGIEFINDSKGTNPEASIKAIEAIKSPIILIAGGMDKGTNYREFIGSFKNKVKHLVLLGETAKIISAEAKDQDFHNITIVEDLNQAVKKSYDIAKKDDTVLLSPACASWDMFNNFEERGDLFKDLVRKLRRS